MPSINLDVEFGSYREYEKESISVVMMKNLEIEKGYG